MGNSWELYVKQKKETMQIQLIWSANSIDLVSKFN